MERKGSYVIVLILLVGNLCHATVTPYANSDDWTNHAMFTPAVVTFDRSVLEEACGCVIEGAQMPLGKTLEFRVGLVPNLTSTFTLTADQPTAGLEFWSDSLSHAGDGLSPGGNGLTFDKWSVTFDGPGPVYGFGVDILDNDDKPDQSPESFRIYGKDGSPIREITPSDIQWPYLNNQTFLGVISSDVSIGRVEFLEGSGFDDGDNILLRRMYISSDVPEPTTVGLLFFGGLLSMRRKR